MNVRDEDDAEHASAKTKQFNFVITVYAASQVVGNFLMKYYNEDASGKDGNSAKEISDIISFHKHIVPYRLDIFKIIY